MGSVYEGRHEAVVQQQEFGGELAPAAVRAVFGGQVPIALCNAGFSGIANHQTVMGICFVTPAMVTLTL